MKYFMLVLAAISLLPSVGYSMEKQQNQVNEKCLWWSEEYEPSSSVFTSGEYKPSCVRIRVNQYTLPSKVTAGDNTIQNNYLLNLPRSEFIALLNQTKTLTPEEKHNISMWHLMPLPKKLKKAEKYYNTITHEQENPQVPSLASAAYNEEIESLNCSLDMLNEEYENQLK